MASLKIQQMRASFDKMSIPQKEAFIKKLRDQRFESVQWQLRREDNAEFSRFLIECTRKYNDELRDAALRKGSTASASNHVKKKGAWMWR